MDNKCFGLCLLFFCLFVLLLIFQKYHTRHNSLFFKLDFFNVENILHYQLLSILRREKCFSNACGKSKVVAIMNLHQYID